MDNSFGEEQNGVIIQVHPDGNELAPLTLLSSSDPGIGGSIIDCLGLLKTSK
jgi:hypothetical protein